MTECRDVKSAGCCQSLTRHLQNTFTTVSIHVVIVLVVLSICTVSLHAKPNSRPNIVYILADDMGYGDVHAFNPDGQIKTPHMDQLAREGMRFTDAHSGSAVCTPTRYGLLTGRYAWRTRLQKHVLWGYSLPLIASDRMTVASLLQQHGYRTACVGKWHLGLEWALQDPAHPPSDTKSESWENIDFAGPIRGGPCERGFAAYFGISASLDMHPHVYIQNDGVTSVPTRLVPASHGKAFWREGPVGEDFRHVDVLDKLTEQAVTFVEQQNGERPFFLYFPLTAPHKPILPHTRFEGKSGLNEWGDFVMQVDWTVGQVMEALERKGLTENTLLIVTSDNGATPGADFGYLAERGHDPSYVFRGHKADIFEGGHRVAFMARWPHTIPAGTTCPQTICHTDLLATVADILQQKLPPNAGEDSVSILPLLQQATTEPVRQATVHHSINGSFAIRQDQWKLILCPGSGGWSEPRPGKTKTKNLPPRQLYNVNTDVGEESNVQDKYPKVVQRMLALMQTYIDAGRSTPGPSQSNDVPILFTP